MNRQLDGWRLGLAILVPAIMVAVAIWIGLQAFGGDDGGEVVDASTQPTATAAPSPTPAEETIVVAEPTEVPTPTPLPLPEPEASPTPAEPEGTPTPDPDDDSDAEPTPTPESSAPSPTSAPSGPTPTPTTDPDLVTIECSASAAFPSTLDIGEALPQLSAAVSPPEAVENLAFVWNFGNGRTTGAPNSGTVRYDDPGTYTVTLAATDKTTGEVLTATCGTVSVGESTGSITTIACQVRPIASMRWDEATINDAMRITTTWEPNDEVLNLQYEFNINDPLIFRNGASSGDNMTRAFQTLEDTVKIFWRNPESGESGRIVCRAFPDPNAVATATPTPSYNNVAAG